MTLPEVTPALDDLAVVREPLVDGHEWSVHYLNRHAHAVVVVVEGACFTWGDLGRAPPPRDRVEVAAGGSACVARVNDGDAEVSMDLSLRLETPTGSYRASYELGKLYRYRDPVKIAGLGRPGWLRRPDRRTPL